MAFKKYKKRKEYRGVRRRRYLFNPIRRQRMFVGNTYYKHNIHKYKRVTDLANNGNSNSGASGGAAIAYDQFITLTSGAIANTVDYYSLGLAFSLGDLQNNTEFSALYDCWKLDYVKIKLLPLQSNSISVTGNVYMNPALTVHYAIDKDDATAPTCSHAGVLALQEYDSYKCKNNMMGRQYFQVGVKPKVAMPLFGTIVTTHYAEGKPVWVDCTNTTTPHYGIKFLFETYNTTNVSTQFKLRVVMTYYFTMKDVR